MQAIAQTAPASHDHAVMARTMPGDSCPDRAVVPIVGTQARLRALARTAVRMQAKLETAGSIKAAPKYWTFDQYDLLRKLYHSPLSRDPCPQVTPEQYQTTIDACPKAPPPREMPVIPKDPLPKGDFPTSTLPPGTAMA